MVKNIFYAAGLLVLLASCSSLKPLHFTSSKPVQSSATGNNEVSSHGTKNSVKFIDDIAVTARPADQPEVKNEKANPSKKETFNTRGFSIEETKPESSFYGDRSATIENASKLQLKYSILLNTEVEQLQDKVLLESVDAWYGTRYRMGGTTKKGIDCSAFVQAVFAAAYSFSLPRTAREQYKAAKRISRTELKEGDLVFFNTTGGISHVGIYMQNNKFIHASASKGVTVSDMYDPYYLSRYIGAGRINDKKDMALSSN